MSMSGKFAVLASLGLAATGAGTALAEDAPKPASPTLSDVLDASGITATGYVDATYSYGDHSAALLPDSTDSVNTFALNQAALTISKLPSSGFGGLVNLVDGTEAGTGLYAPSYSYAGNINGGSHLDVLQAYVQYATGKTTVLVGKFTTLAGAEVAAPVGDVNVTRSLLFWYSEPINHTGVRVVYAASSTASFMIGANNGWNAETSTGSGKTLELGFSLTPSKAVALTGAAYYGDTDVASGLGKKTLVDLVGTFTVSPALTLVANVDWDKQEITHGGGSLTWWAAAGYVNYAVNDSWRTSLRLEYLDDQDGAIAGTRQKLKEGTLTVAYLPSKNYEFRVEARHDTSDLGGSTDITQAWLQALYKF
ncbi:MAG TPA: outer membrane beta-barrel protein [Burkholderiaceae bacterium]|nr:outer membrane beta-barrel protein [Burkholderiaceae bacterium]